MGIQKNLAVRIPSARADLLKPTVWTEVPANLRQYQLNLATEIGPVIDVEQSPNIWWLLLNPDYPLSELFIRVSDAGDIYEIEFISRPADNLEEYTNPRILSLPTFPSQDQWARHNYSYDEEGVWTGQIVKAEQLEDLWTRRESNWKQTLDPKSEGAVYLDVLAEALQVIFRPLSDVALNFLRSSAED